MTIFSDANEPALLNDMESCLNFLDISFHFQVIQQYYVSIDDQILFANY